MCVARVQEEVAAEVQSVPASAALGELPAHARARASAGVRWVQTHLCDVWRASAAR